MYETCMFCHRPLGENQVVEHFPVGRRLAFDSGKGRLWVVCRRCERWNLTPMEERWEAIEGELTALEAAWKAAEEIAEISDNLLLPEGTDEFLNRHREPEGSDLS